MSTGPNTSSREEPWLTDAFERSRDDVALIIGARTRQRRCAFALPRSIAAARSRQTASRSIGPDLDIGVGRIDPAASRCALKRFSLNVSYTSPERDPARRRALLACPTRTHLRCEASTARVEVDRPLTIRRVVAAELEKVARLPQLRRFVTHRVSHVATEPVNEIARAPASRAQVRHRRPSRGQ